VTQQGKNLPPFIYFCKGIHKLFPLIKFLAQSVDNCSVLRAEKNIFKTPFQKLYIILVASKHLGKFTFDKSIYSCWQRRKDSQADTFKLLQMYLLFNTTFPMVFKQLNLSFGLDKY